MFLNVWFLTSASLTFIDYVVFLGEKNSALENGFSEAPTAESTTMEKPSSESAGSYLGAGDGITSPTKPLSQTNHEQTDTEYRLRLASQEKVY